MNNKLPEDSMFRKKSFFVALYSCVGVVLILAAVISYININQATPKTNQPQNIDGMDETLASKTSPNPEISSSADETMIAQAQAEAARRAIESQRNAAESITKAKPSITVTPAPIPTAAQAVPTTAPTAAAEPEAKEQDNSLAEPVFESFNDGETMEWPILGDIVMDYSITRTLYDETLDQRRTNDSLWISADPGTPVKAACDGVVQKIDKTRKDGTTVTIDDGNGWTTTYGQLLDSVLVKEGDVVKRGQIIGGIASPTIYGVLQGPHLSFKVAKDDITVDPKTVLKTVDIEAVSTSN